MFETLWKRGRRCLGRYRLLPDRRWPRLLGLERRGIRTVFDVGAFDGDTAKLFRRLFPAATIRCFEPAPEEFARLSRWAATQGGAVTCEHCGLGSADGVASLAIYPESAWISSMRSGSARWADGRAARGGGEPKEIRVPLRRLDEAAQAGPIEGGVLVKIDVEGMEADVIRGGMGILGRAEACIVEVTVEPRFDAVDDLAVIAGLLADAGLGYAGNLTQRILPDGTVRYVDALFMRRSPRV